MQNSKETIIENVNFASTRKYTFCDDIKELYGDLQGYAAPKRAWAPPFLFQNLSSYKINNQ